MGFGTDLQTHYLYAQERRRELIREADLFRQRRAERSLQRLATAAPLANLFITLRMRTGRLLIHAGTQIVGDLPVSMSGRRLSPSGR